MTFYLKYRPQKISELDQDAVRTKLEKVVKSGKIPQAFLFAGPKGTGKTSAARIIAKVVNCEKNTKKLNEPCGKCTSCKEIAGGGSIDVVEMDAASNRGIDDIRQIRDSVKLAPARYRKKFYIIDEAHMLTTEASNALLKTLEEPPDHVIFILATTNPEKLLDTIKSRTTLVTFKPATIDELVRSLQKIAKGEKAKITKDALTIIAKNSDGSFRDAAKIFEQLLTEKVKLEASTIENYLEKAVGGYAEKIMQSFEKEDTEESIRTIEKFKSGGGDINQLTKNLMSLIHNSILAKNLSGEDDFPQLSESRLIGLYDLLLDAISTLNVSPIPELSLEAAFIKWRDETNSDIKSADNDDEMSKNSDRTGGKFKNGNGKVKKMQANPALKENHSKSKTFLSSNFGEDIWLKILGAVKSANTSVEALLRATKPLEFDGKTLKLGVFYKFHKERLEENKNRMVLESTIEKILSIPARVECILTNPPIRTEPKTQTVLKEPESKESDIVKVAKEVFGS